MKKTLALLFAQLLFVSSLVLTVTSCGGSSSPPPITVPHTSAEFLYVATNTFPSNTPQQVLGFPIDLSTGALGSPVSVSTANAPVGIVADPAGKFLYFTDELTGSIHGFILNQASGALTELAGSPFPARPDGSNIFPGLLFTDITGNFVYEVHGVLWGLSKSSTGGLTPFGGFQGNALTASFHPTNQFVYTGECDGRFNLPVCLYDRNSAGALGNVPLESINSIAAATVHDTAVHPGGGFLYGSGNFDPSPPGQPPAGTAVVLSFAIDRNTGLLSPLPALMTNLEPSENFTDIAMHPAGKFLYVNTQDKIFGFAINAQGGLTAVPGSPFPGKLTPATGWGFRIDATGQFLYESMVDSQNFPATVALSGFDHCAYPVSGDPKLSRFAGVSLGGPQHARFSRDGVRACRRNPERAERVEGSQKSVVRKGGLEPPRFYPPDPKSGASANSATFALPANIYLGQCLYCKAP